ncbi:hypothetical protein [Sporosarcina highlanderae]|uniref:Uncharacterized protein n=1 Tax=Sporosarcina highlanderae TaxID=3035916 RepID=A0ABT8JL71_9BACL|nr:hypothetical protein [Sporosarcina highlanderae]MDN4605904.1 hypothetical protein [Sporosarcina highlanderae]
MQDKIKALLFDFTEDNLNVHQASKADIISGRNILKDGIQIINGEFSDTPFVQIIEIDSFVPDKVENVQMSNILGIDESELCVYSIYSRTFKESRSFTRGELSSGYPGDFTILTNKAMFEKANPIFEIRFKKNEKWSSWQAIAGKFIVAQNYKFGPGGIAEVYSSMSEKVIETFSHDFQIRYSGSGVSEFGMVNSLHRIIKDPIHSDIRKIIDPFTFQILFDSQLIQELSSEKSIEAWRKFEERYC